MQKILRKLAYLIFLRHKWILLIFVLMTTFFGYLVSKININAGMLDAFPENNPVIDEFVDFLNDFGSLDNLIIVLESEHNNVDSNIGLVELIVKNLKGSPIINDVDYNILHSKGNLFIKHFPLFIQHQDGFDALRERLSPSGIRLQIKRNRYNLLSPISSIFESELIAKDPLNLREILIDQIAGDDIGSAALSEGYYISNDNSMLLVFVEPVGSSRDIKFMSQLKVGVDQIIERSLKELGNQDGLKIGFAGPYSFASEAQKIIKRDVARSFLFSIAIIAFLFRFVYKTRLTVLIMIICSLFSSLLWTLGIAYLIFGSLNLVCSIVAAMLMGIGIDYIIHIFKRFESEFIATGNPYKALEIALTKTGIGVFTGALTTSFAFFSIIVTNFKGLHQLGIVAGIGVLSSLFVTIIVLTSLFVWAGINRPNIFFITNRKDGKIYQLPRFVIPRSKFFLVVGLILFLLAPIGAVKIRFDTGPEAMGLKDSTSLVMEERLAEKFNKEDNPLFVTCRENNKVDLFNSFNVLESKLIKWENENVIASYNSLSLFIPPLFQQTKALENLQEIGDAGGINIEELDKVFEDALKKNGFNVHDYTLNYIKGIKDVMLADKLLDISSLDTVENKKIKHFYNKNKNRMAAYIFPDDGKWEEAEINTINSDLNTLGDKFSLLGVQLMFRELKDSIIFESALATIIAVIVVFLMLYLQFKSIKKVVIVLIPLILGYVYTAGLMGIAGINFNYINIAALTILFGIGVDYGIYIVQGYYEDDCKDLERCLRHVGQAVIMCAFTTIVGFGSLMTIHFSGIASLGLIISFGVMFCLFSAIFLLPSILSE